MTSIINELWYGNICPQEDGILDMPDIKELLGYIARHQADLEAILTDKQKNLLEKMMYNRIEFDTATGIRREILKARHRLAGRATRNTRMDP